MQRRAIAKHVPFLVLVTTFLFGALTSTFAEVTAPVDQREPQAARLAAGMTCSQAAAIGPRREVVTVRPSALASFIDELAGRTVRVRNARVVGVFNPRAFLIESATSVPVMLGTRNRLLVLVDESAALRVAPATIVGSNVIVFGVARTLLGVRVTSEVTWPPELAENVVKRLEVRGAVLAISVQTAEGVELTDRKNTRAQDR